MQTTLCVAGAGTMGSGIAVSAASNGIPVILYDLDSAVIKRSEAQISRDLAEQQAKQRIDAAEKEAILKRIRFTSSLRDCCADIVLEAVVEKKEVKAALFRKLKEQNSPHTIFATNTSSLSVTEIAEESGMPARVIGMHFFNPANRMKLVEVVRTRYTPAETVERIRGLAVSMGKTPVICQDAPGFIVNRVARPFYLESLRLAEQGVADIQTIDRLTEAAGFKMGPFHLMDLIGNDINYTVSCSLYEALGKPERLKPVTLQETIVRNGRLGRKTGAGFFDYKK